MEIIINEDKLKAEEIEERETKVRAILQDEDQNVLAACYGETILLPGGKVDKNETIEEAIIRELKEETGQTYDISELEYFLTLKYYQKNYQKRNGKTKNRLITTHFFLGKYKGLNQEHQALTEKEKQDGFHLEMTQLELLESEALHLDCKNPRSPYFRKELLVVLGVLGNQPNNDAPTLTLSNNE